jgi:glycosyltransferase involved in cell wall biosynthesis
LGFGAKAFENADSYVLAAPKSAYGKFFWRLVFHPLVYQKLKQTLQKIAPDVIHLHNIKQHTPTLLRAIKGYPIVQTVHDFSYICPTAQNLHKDNTVCTTGLRLKCLWQHQVKFNRLTYLAALFSFYYLRKKSRGLFQSFIAPSPILADYLSRNAYAPVTFIPPFKPTLLPLSFATQDKNFFLFAGNLGAHKGVFLLLDEFAKAVKSNPHLVLAIAGTGRDEKKVLTKIQSLDLSKNILLLGWQTDLSYYYQRCQALIFPSIGMEAFGLVMLEAMAHGRAIIGINRGTAAWLIKDKSTGLLFDPQKKGDLAAKITTLAADEILAQQLGAHAYQKLQTYSDDNTLCRSIIEVYCKVLGK